MKALIICAAPETDFKYISGLAETADIVLCADGGLEYAKACSIIPDAVIGDFDSFAGDIPGEIEVIRLDTRKDNTDTICCIDKAVSLGCDEIILVCAVGGRIDHTLANIAALDYIMQKGAEGKIVSANENIRLLTVGKYSFENLRGRVFSLFAFNCGSCTVSYENTEYLLEHYTLSAAYPLGISNVFADDSACIDIHSGKAVLIINSQI